LCHDISGGPLTVTDANLILGRLISDHFPALFGPKGNEPLDPEASSVKFKELAEIVELLFVLSNS
jgi:5-oxoprolinase (ATP-hydrolysing)